MILTVNGMGGRPPASTPRGYGLGLKSPVMRSSGSNRMEGIKLSRKTKNGLEKEDEGRR